MNRFGLRLVLSFAAIALLLTLGWAASPAGPAAPRRPGPVLEPPRPPQLPTLPLPPVPDKVKDEEAGREAIAGQDREAEGRARRRSSADEVSIGEDVTIGPDEYVPDGLVCIGGAVKIEGEVQGDVVVIAGRAEITGSILGELTGIGSDLHLKDGARVRGGVANVMGQLQRTGDVKIEDEVVNIGAGRGLALLTPLFALPFGMLGLWVLWVVLLELAFILAVLVLAGALAPERVRLIAEEAPLRPFLAFAVGVGAYAVLLIGCLLLCITCIGIPLAVLVYFAFLALKWLGMAGLFLAVGRRLGRLLGREMSLLGGIVLGLLPFALLRFLPFCIGATIWFVVEVLAVGLVLLTRAGTRRAAPASAAVPTAGIVGSGAAIAGATDAGAAGGTPANGSSPPRVFGA